MNTTREFAYVYAIPNRPPQAPKQQPPVSGPSYQGMTRADLAQACGKRKAAK